MRKIEEIQTVTAVSIVLAIIPIDRWTFAVLAFCVMVLGLRIARSLLRRFARWERIAGTSFALMGMLLFMLPAIIQRYR